MNQLRGSPAHPPPQPVQSLLPGSFWKSGSVAGRGTLSRAPTWALVS